MPTRRVLLAAPLVLAVPARAQAVDESLTGLMRRGSLRVSIGYWAADFLPQEGQAAPRVHDRFHTGMAQMIGRRLGVRTEIQEAQQSGDGVQRLRGGMVDLALAPPITRGMLRNIMFCTPHIAMDLVLLAHGRRGHSSRRQDLLGLRLASLGALAAAVVERSTPGSLPEIEAISAPWPLARRLLEEEVDGIIVTNLMARAMIRRFPGSGLRVQNAIINSVFGGAVAYGAHDLLRALNVIVDGARQDGSLDALYREETGLPLPHPDAS